jgi:hypothetical protein
VGTVEAVHEVREELVMIVEAMNRWPVVKVPTSVTLLEGQRAKCSACEAIIELGSGRWWHLAPYSKWCAAVDPQPAKGTIEP